MKRFFTAILAALVALAAMTASAEMKISVSGTGEVMVAADTAVVTLGVTLRDSDALMAQTKVNETIERIRASLIEQGFRKEDINTDRIHMYAVYDYSSDVGEITGYNASSYLAIRTNDMDVVGKIIDIAFAAGANSLDGIQFSASDTTLARKEAMIQAVQDAREKAEILASAVGMTVTGIETVSEGSSFSFDSGLNAFYKSVDDMDVEEAAAGTVVQAAKLNVSCTVSMVFTADVE